MRYDGVLLCSDFDGTLAYYGKVSKENIEAIKMFQENGGLFTLSTGRTPYFITENFKDLKVNAPMICVNGASIFDCAQNKELMTSLLGNTSAFAKDMFCHKSCQGVRLILQDYSTVAIEKGDVETLQKHVNDPMFKMVYVFEDTEAPIENLNKYIKLYGNEFYFSRSWEYSLEVSNITATKGKMLQKLKTMLPNVTTTIGVGDFDNDVSLVKEADIGYAVANAEEVVKEVADRITVPCQENAIAKIIYEL